MKHTFGKLHSNKGLFLLIMPWLLLAIVLASGQIVRMARADAPGSNKTSYSQTSPLPSATWTPGAPTNPPTPTNTPVPPTPTNTPVPPTPTPVPVDGFVTGGGWIDSPSGAYKPDPALTGKATFAFVAKYQKSASVPAGNTQFHFSVADLKFSSSGYVWLGITVDNTIRFKGFGTINGKDAGGDQPYQFMIWAKDGTPDTFRIKIWRETGISDVIVYDTATKQPIGGSIVIHPEE